ncbi:MAG: MBL fold metallo-hydrolase [Gammaproteobacteria bacterium]
MLQLRFLGTGSAFTVGAQNYQSNMLLEHSNGTRLMIDCGTDARHALHDAGVHFYDIEAVYISHLHADHVGGLEWLGFCNKFSSHGKKPKLFIQELLVDSLWRGSLAAGMSSLEEKQATLDDYFDLHAVKQHFTWQRHQFELVPTLHVVSNKQQLGCFGLFFKMGAKRILITCDTRFTPEHLQPYYEAADIIFHDCELKQPHSGVHSHYSELCTLDKKYKSKMWLYHYEPVDLPDAKQQGFQGFVVKGQTFTFNSDAK